MLTTSNPIEIHEAIQDGLRVLWEAPGQFPVLVTESTWSGNELLIRPLSTRDFTWFCPDTDSCTIQQSAK